MRSTDAHRLDKIFIFLFICMMGSQILLSARPDDIGIPILFHVASLGLILIYGVMTFLVRTSSIQPERLMQVAVIFLAYFYSVGVIMSMVNGVKLLNSIEFPYRICNLFLIFVIPMFIKKEEDLSKFLVLVMIMVALVTINDMTSWIVKEDGNAKTAMRIVGPDFSSSHISLVPLAFGGLIAYWNAKTHRGFKRFLLVTFWSLLICKVFLSFSRVVWIVFPVNIVAIYFLLWLKSQVSPEFRQWGRRIARIILFFAILSFIGVIFLAIYVPQIADFISLRQQLTGNEMNNRLSEYGNAFQEWLRSPIWGHGFGFQTQLFKGSWWRQQDYVHNFVLQFLQSAGLIGLGLILSLLGVTFFRLMKLLNRSRSLMQSAALITGIMIIFNVSMLGMVYTLLLKQETYFILAVAISIGIIVERLQRQEARRPALIIRMNESHLPGWERTPGKVAVNPER
jgi:O-antigen ligase